MIRVPARFYDGATSRVADVTVRFGAGGSITIEADGGERHVSAEDLSIGSRLGATARVISLADGGRLEVDDNDALDRALAAIRGRAPRHPLDVLERRWPLVALAVAVTVASGYGIARHGIPAAAKFAADHMPARVEAMLTDRATEFADGPLFAPSRLSIDTRAHVATLFDRVVAPDGRQYRLLFRYAPALGANAFALPGGTVLVTDGLVEMALSDAELLGVLAHEVGHVAGRHTVRKLLQNGATAALIGFITGDISTASTLAAALPTVLVEAHYSREFEREADRFAHSWMRAHGEDPGALGALLARMDEGAPGMGWLSTHPATPERVHDLTSP